MASRPSFEVPETVPVELTERCDRCGARASHRVTLRTGELYLCTHHHRAHAEALAKVVLVPSSL